MKKAIFILFFSLYRFFYSASNMNVTDYYYELFGTNKDKIMFFM